MQRSATVLEKAWKASDASSGFPSPVMRHDVNERQAVLEPKALVLQAFGLQRVEVGEDRADEAGVLVGALGLGDVADDPRDAHDARTLLLRASWVTSARPSSSSSGGRYIPNRPR